MREEQQGEVTVQAEGTSVSQGVWVLATGGHWGVQVWTAAQGQLARAPQRKHGSTVSERLQELRAAGRYKATILQRVLRLRCEVIDNGEKGRNAVASTGLPAVLVLHPVELAHGYNARTAAACRT